MTNDVAKDLVDVDQVRNFTGDLCIGAEIPFLAVHGLVISS